MTLPHLRNIWSGIGKDEMLSERLLLYARISQFIGQTIAYFQDLIKKLVCVFFDQEACLMFIIYKSNVTIAQYSDMHLIFCTLLKI